MSNLLAAVGCGQMQVLADRVAANRRIFDTYAQAVGGLPGITLMPEASWGRCTRWRTCITVDPLAFGADREGICLTLAAENIESRPLWKPKPGISGQGMSHLWVLGCGPGCSLRRPGRGFVHGQSASQTLAMRRRRTTDPLTNPLPNLL